MFIYRQNGLIYESHCINYCGDIIYENIKPVPNRILFDGGYITFSNKQPVYHFYLTDHQGNVRVVASVDPLAEKYPDVSPYVYCHDNPVNKIDPDGMDDYYTIFGNYLYSDNKETDNIIIRNEELYRVKQKTGLSWMVTDIPFIEATLSAEAYSNIFTDILSKMEGVNVNDLYNSKVSVTVWEDCGNLKAVQDQYNDAGLNGEVLAQIGSYQGKQRLMTYIDPDGHKEKDLFSSRSNIQNLLGVHEYIEHFKNDIGNGDHSHLRIYKNMQKHNSWIKTTRDYKDYMIKLYVTQYCPK